MSDQITAYPLAWPVSRPRTETRQSASFGERRPGSSGIARWQRLTVSAACDRLNDELRRLRGSSSWVVSTNVPTNRDNWPRGGLAEPRDPGAAVYFKWRGRDYCLACDRWDRVADNIAAIAAEIEASRGRERWGVVTLEEAFQGFAALPARKPWWQVLGFKEPPGDLVQLKARYRELARRHHPDAGGSHEVMAELSEAYEEGQTCLGRRDS